MLLTCANQLQRLIPAAFYVILKKTRLGACYDTVYFTAGAILY